MGEPHWEPPLVEPLFVTSYRVAEILDLPYDQMSRFRYCLDTRYFGELGGAPRISMASLKEYVELVDAGETRDDALTLLARRYGPGQQDYTPRYSFEQLRRMKAMDRIRATYWRPPPAQARRNNYWRKNWWN